MKSFFRSFSATVLLTAALLLGWLALRQWERRSWIPVRAEVTQAWEKTYVMPPMQGKWVSTPPQPRDFPWIVYSYKAFGTAHSGGAAASGAVGAVRTVYYDPDDPDRSVVERPEGFAVLLSALGSVALLSGGLLVGLKGSRPKTVSSR